MERRNKQFVVRRSLGFLGCLGETQAGAGHVAGGGLDPGVEEGTREWDKKGTRDWAWGMGMRCQSSQ